MSSSPRRRLRGLRRRWREERGVVLVWFALMLVVLIGFAGFAVDLSNWWLQAEKLQRAADAGAHAGVVFLPADMSNATSTARAEMAKNGYRVTGANANATASITQEPNPNRLRVRLTTTVPSYFVQLLGVDEVELTREAVAEYVAPVPMGSPENKLGNDPARGNVAAQLWVNIAGPNGNKGSGDRYQSKNCPTSVARCTGTANAGIQNDDYSTDGYFFALKVANRPSGQPLNVEVYDPGMIYVGDTCTNATFPNATQLTTLSAWYPDAAQRFAGGLTSWCTGDQDIGGRTTQTTFIVRAPDDTPWSFTDNPVVSNCTTTMPAYNPGASGNPTIYQYLHPGDGVQDDQAVRNGVAPWTFAEVFRQNVNICSIPAAQVLEGDYILQVRSNATAAAPTVYSTTMNQGGHNRMSLQVGFGTTGVTTIDGSNVSINALGRLPIYANANSANTNFYLARVLPYDAGRTLRVNLYDISDVGDSGTMQILPPAEIGGTFSGCGFSNDTNKSMSVNTGTCTLTVPNGYYNERIVTVDVPIPTDYDCDPDVPTDCWITVRAAFNGPVTDTTTWSAAILGNPIRLVE
jgi:hypothetical protein